MSATLQQLVDAGLGLEVLGDAGVAVTGVRHDSRAVEAGDLFVAVPGQTTEGARFAKDALDKGAVALAVEERLGLDAPQLVVANARRALGALAAFVYGDPTSRLKVIGLTGTNGKTTTTWLIDEALRALGERPALLGTIESRGPGVKEPAPFTTPEGDAIARFAERVADAGATHLVMEVSSHALAQHRADAVRFAVAGFTNLSQDHLDFHGTMEAYFEAKARLFTELSPGAAVINVDDPRGAELATRVPSATRLIEVSGRGRSSSFSSCSRNDEKDEDRPRLVVVASAAGRDGIRATLAFEGAEAELSSPMLGAHNLENLALAAGCLVALGHPLGDAVEALGRSGGAPGRLERVEGLDDVMVLVDYAHTPDALERALAALRPVTPGRLIAVFGCGGDRDRAKRPLMGAAAAEGADLCAVTSDNPRTEDPHAILAMIEPAVAERLPRLAALTDADRGYVLDEDRRAAIRAAIDAAQPGDTVLIAGKGHEDYQIRGTTKIHFDDREEARAAITDRTGRGE